MWCHHLEILHAPTAIRLLILEPHIRKLHMAIDNGQVVCARPFVHIPVRDLTFTIGLAVAPMATLQKALIVPFQLEVEDDSTHAGALCMEAFPGPQVRSIELGIVSELPPFHEAGIERLPGFSARTSTGVQHVTPAVCQGHQRQVFASRHVGLRANQAGLAEPPQIATAGVRRPVCVVTEIRRGHNPKGTHARERTHLRAAQVVRATAHLHTLAAWASRQVEATREDLARVIGGGLARVAGHASPSAQFGALRLVRSRIAITPHL
jgi:hypothetical protein